MHGHGCTLTPKHMITQTKTHTLTPAHSYMCTHKHAFTQIHAQRASSPQSWGPFVAETRPLTPRSQASPLSLEGLVMTKINKSKWPHSDWGLLPTEPFPAASEDSQRAIYNLDTVWGPELPFLQGNCSLSFPTTLHISHQINCSLSAQSALSFLTITWGL